MAKISYSLLGGISAIVGAGLFNFVWHYGSKPLGANQEIVNTITGKAVILSDLTVVSGIACPTYRLNVNFLVPRTTGLYQNNQIRRTHQKRC